MIRLLLTGTMFLFSFFANAQPTAGLVAYWPMNGNFTDAGPNNIATSNNGGVTAAANVFGTANSSMSFSNPTGTVVQYGTTAITSALNFTGDFSLDFSVYISSMVHTIGFFDNCINYNGYGGWFWNPSGYIQLQFNFKNKSLASVGSTTFVVNTWYHICCQRSAGTLKLYVNGVLNNSTTEGTSAPTYSYNPKIGTMFFNSSVPPNYNGFNGNLDEFRIYNRALTPAEITLLYQLTILPVKLTSFSASTFNDNVQLQWQTSSEQNSDHFDIQRSTDGSRFESIGQVRAAGNSVLPQQYRFTDALLPSIPTVFYRLDMIDKDGKHEYSRVVAVHLNKGGVELLIAPNPASKLLQVQTGNHLTGDAIIEILDINGKQWIKKQVSFQSGTNSNSINIEALPAASYLLKISSGSSTYVKQFIKQ